MIICLATFHLKFALADAFLFINNEDLSSIYKSLKCCYISGLIGSLHVLDYVHLALAQYKAVSALWFLKHIGTNLISYRFQELLNKSKFPCQELTCFALDSLKCIAFSN